MFYLSKTLLELVSELRLLPNENGTHANSENVESCRGILDATVTLALPLPTSIGPSLTLMWWF